MKGLDPGQLHKLDESRLGDRDAFHLPGVMCTTHELLYPGTFVKVGKSGDAYYATRCEDPSDAHGVVDPMIPYEPIDDYGQMFWVFLKRELVGPVTHNFEILGVGNKTSTIVENDDDDDDDYAECRGCS